MTDDLCDECDAINSIYDHSTLVASSDPQIYILRLPQHTTSLRIHFPTDYPATSPSVLGTESSGDQARHGDGAHIVHLFRDALSRVYRPGTVCLFDVIEEVNQSLESTAGEERHGKGENSNSDDAAPHINNNPSLTLSVDLTEAPPWTLSEPITALKSTFLARCAPVSSPSQARSYLAHLLASDKKVRGATHNITAFRIRGAHDVAYQDCDDDGETAAGGRVLHLMQMMGVWDVLVVVSRWYGGQKLGPKRFSVINSVARDALVKGQFVVEDPKKGVK